MHSENLKFLYREYRNCMKNQFSEYFGKDDEYRSYAGKCMNQKNDIDNYVNSHFSKVGKINPKREDREVHARYQEKIEDFTLFGWSVQEIKN
jgi:hypothetical protein